MTEKQLIENELALSNSQPTLHNLKYGKNMLHAPKKEKAQATQDYFNITDYAVKTGYVNSYIDRLTITGNLPDEYIGLDDPFGIMPWVRLATFAGGGWRGQYFPDRKQKLYLEYDPANAEKMRKRNFRVECNPNLLAMDQLHFLFDTILPKLTKPAISRLDLAFDFERNLNEFRFDKAVTGGKFWDKAGKTQTVYFGAPSSDCRIRIYDKKAERLAKGSEEDKADYSAYDVLWRLEFELTGSGYIEKAVRQNFRVLQDTKIVKRNYEMELDVPLSPLEKIMIKALDNEKDLFAELAPASKAKYRKMADKVVEVDLTDNLRELLRNMQVGSDSPLAVDVKTFCTKILAGENPIRKG
ncbi:hypothetical protein P6Z85_14565 [Enterococcus faecium]|uniref:Replication initiation protein n=1 Tax=Enterococcus faecium TaxID=1352 RepID=A0AAW8RKW5_ENTFC|nr:hypothetical protein [Enterococcus faecium]MDT2371330.1 hypothetical protein [Enterococcus faecium]